MQPKQTEQTLAEQLFFQTDLNQTDIAKQVGVTDRTLSRWVKDNQWKQLKEQARYMPAQIVDNFQVQLTKLQQNIMTRQDPLPTLEEVNIMSRLVLCIARMKVQVTKISNIEVLQNYIGFVGTIDEDLANENTRLANQFLNGKPERGFFPYEIGYNSEPDSEEIQEQLIDSDIHNTELRNTSPSPSERGSDQRSGGEVPTGQDRTTPSLNINNLQPKPDNENIVPPKQPLYKPAIKYNGHWLDWKGNGMVLDYDTNKIRRMTTDEWNAFLTTGYKLSELDNYPYKSDPIYDEERRTLTEEKQKAHAEYRERIERFKESMKRDDYRDRSKRKTRW